MHAGPEAFALERDHVPFSATSLDGDLEPCDVERLYAPGIGLAHNLGMSSGSIRIVATRRHAGDAVTAAGMEENERGSRLARCVHKGYGIGSRWC